MLCSPCFIRYEATLYPTFTHINFPNKIASTIIPYYISLKTLIIKVLLKQTLLCETIASVKQYNLRGNDLYNNPLIKDTR